MIRASCFEQGPFTQRRIVLQCPGMSFAQSRGFLNAIEEGVVPEIGLVDDVERPLASRGKLLARGVPVTIRQKQLTQDPHVSEQQ